MPLTKEREAELTEQCRQFRIDVLTEEARDVPAGRRQRVVDDRRNQHLDDRCRRPAAPRAP